MVLITAEGSQANCSPARTSGPRRPRPRLRPPSPQQSHGSPFVLRLPVPVRRLGYPEITNYKWSRDVTFIPTLDNARIATVMHPSGDTSMTTKSMWYATVVLETHNIRVTIRQCYMTEVL